MRRPVYVVDAFTDRALAGNPAAVVLDGADLDDAQLAAIAREMNHSETAFPLPARDPRAALHLRWFTPSAEVAFCGHATLATFTVLVEEAKRIRVGPEPVRVGFTCKSGLLQVELSRDARSALEIRIETPKGGFERAQLRGDVLVALGLVPEVLDPARPPQRSTVLEGNLYVAVRDRAALSRCRIDAPVLLESGRELGISGYVVYTLAPEPGVDAALRCFFPGDGIPEDPVTGSAAGQLGLLLHAQDPRGALPRRLVFTQGDEVGRPGRVEVELRPDREPGTARALVGGKARVVLRGELDLR